MLNLYVMEGCPYCKKVLKFLDENGIKFKKLDISEPKNREELLALGGELQVPFLFDDENDVKMYESEDIIEYIKSQKN